VFWPFIAYVAAVVAVVSGMLLISWLLGERHKGRATGESYESGIPPTGTARIRISAKFYLTAMFFVIFDLAAAFVFAWAIAIRQVGWRGYLGIVAFIATLVSALCYLSREGALDWGVFRGKMR
jgi:NADH-quinone oxidoreductase subunit A